MRTFVLRIWEGAVGGSTADAGELRGVLEEIRSGEATTFTRAEELVNALRRAIRQLRDTGATSARPIGTVTPDEEERDA